MADRTEEALRLAVIENPNDDDARLVLADVLLEHGDPQGELIQLQISHARLPEKSPEKRQVDFRIKRLVAAHGPRIAGDVAKFGGMLGIAVGATNIGVIGPTAYYADTRVRVTANGSDFTGGKVRLIAYFMEMSAPAA